MKLGVDSLSSNHITTPIFRRTSWNTTEMFASQTSPEPALRTCSKNWNSAFSFSSLRPVFQSWIIALLVLCGLGLLPHSHANSSLTCSSIRYAYSARGFSEKDIPKEPVSGTNLRFCPEGLTCCTEQMEFKWSGQIRQEYDSVVKEATSSLQSTFVTRTKKFDEFFRELLENSKKDFHDMFKRTYGILYEQNSAVFTDLFRDLEDYYTRGRIDLEDAMDDFFTTLYQRMFTVLNAQYRFDDSYLGCVSKHMKELKPFGDVPKKLSLQVKRSFIATRTFAQALGIGRDVINKVLAINPSGECSRALMKMSFCPACRGLSDLKPCSVFCMNVLKGCLAYHNDFSTEWDNYIDAVVKVADRLLGPFNIELVVDPIDIKISDAIMNFQESGYDVTQKVFKGCGTPRLGKREASELDFESLRFDKPTGSRPTTAAGTSLDRLVRDIKQKMKSTKGIWGRLPHQVCSHEKVGALDTNCWNGSEHAKDGNVVSEALVGTELDPRAQTLINDEILNLRRIVNKLENAHNGIDVDWTDGDWAPGSGSGSGSGDGRDDDTEDEDEDDRDVHGGPRPPVQPSPPRGRPGLGEEDDINFNNTPKPDRGTDQDQTRVNSGTSGSAPGQGGTTGNITAAKALTTYLVPIVVAWIGRMF